MIIAFSFILAHNLIPHHHHFEAGVKHHHHEGDHDHNVFSFVQLDADFIPSQNQVNARDFVSFCYLPLNKTVEIVNMYSNPTELSDYREFPPPKKHVSAASHRGPPNS